MKKLILISSLLFSMCIYSQDTSRIQRFSLGIGPSLGIGGPGGNAQISYSISKKFNIKLGGVLNYKKDQITNNANIERSFAYDISIYANCFLVVNTSPKNKVNIYIGWGLGYLNRTQNDVGFIAGYVYKQVGQGLATGLNLGGSVKLGPGRLYVEYHTSIALFGSDYSKNIEYFGYPQQPQVFVNRNNAGPYGVVFSLNVGYAVPF